MQHQTVPRDAGHQTGGPGARLGEDWTQKKISQLEGKDRIEPAILQQVSGVLKIPVEAFQNFDEEQAVNFISNTFNDQSNGYNYHPVFNVNPIEKCVEALDKNEKLYERLLQTEREKMKLTQGMLERMK